MASSARRYHTIPYPQNPGFYGRDDVLQAIDAAFKERAPRVASVALWGAAGIGKTQIALEIAHKHWSDGPGATLWIACDTSTSVANSFNNAALHLQLKDESEANTPERNRHLVLQWLQNTDVPWLLVFDDVECHEQLAKSWPPVGRGKILITCRSELLAESRPIARPIEVPPFTVAESTELILGTLNNTSPAPDEVAATNRLSTKLGGLAVAVDMIARQIKVSRHFKSVAEYLPHFEQNPSCALKRAKHWDGNVWYSKTPNSLWRTAFEDLSVCGAEMLGILCFMSPDRIPLFLFNRDEMHRLWPQQRLLEIRQGLEEATNELLSCALVRINAAEGLVSVHRLIQESFFSHMTAEARINAFHSALRVLRAHFPRSPSTAVHLWTKWDQCEDLHQHVIAFSERYQSMEVGQGFAAKSLTYTRFILDHIWYMMEVGHFLRAESSLLSLLKDTDGSSCEVAIIHRSLVRLYERTGRSKKACAAANTQFAFQQKHFAGNEATIANAHNHLGYALTSAYKPSEALTYLNAAVALAKAHPEPKRYQTYILNNFLLNRGLCKAQLGQLDEAVSDFLEAETIQTKVHGPGSYHDEHTKHERAKVAARKGHLEAAGQLSREAQALFSLGRPEHPSVAGALYQRARVAMLQGNNGRNNETALQHLKQALSICKANESRGGNRGEAARVRWRMAQVYERMGKVEEAGRLLAEAEKVKRELVATGEYAVVPAGFEGAEKEETEWDALVGLLYR